jgi:hypothetical protein
MVVKKSSVYISLILTSLILIFGATPALASQPYFFFYHQTESSIVNGKSTYDDARFGFVYWDITDTDPALENVAVTIENGSYSYGTWSNLRNKQPIGTITNADFTFNTKYFSSNEAHIPVNSAGERLYFWGTANSGFSGKGYSYSLNGAATNGVLPDFRSTGEQLMSCVPYVEYILNSSNLITGLNVSFINPSNPAQTLVKTPEIDVSRLERVVFDDWKGDYFSRVRMNKIFADGDELKYQVTYDKPVNPDEIRGVEVRFGQNLPSGISALYRWYFYTNNDSSSASLNPFFGTWEAAEGKSRNKWGTSLPLKISESNLQIKPLPNGNVTISFYIHHEDKNDKRTFSGRSGRHEVELSTIEGTLPKTIKWKETKKMTRNGIASDATFNFTIELKDSETVSIRVFDNDADSTATFKLKK